MGSNPAAWFVVVAIVLTLARWGLDAGKEAHMKKTKSRRKAQVKSRIDYVKKAFVAHLETLWAITASFAAGLVTLSTYQKGTPR